MGKSKKYFAPGCLSSEHNRIKLFHFPRDSARYEPELKDNYKTIAKNLHYNNLIYNCNNKMKTTWSIIQSDTGRKINNAGIQFLNIGGKLSDIHDVLTDSLNNSFQSIADKINTNNANVGQIIVGY
jgi:hypothetical protein